MNNFLNKDSKPTNEKDIPHGFWVVYDSNQEHLRWKGGYINNTPVGLHVDYNIKGKVTLRNYFIT